MKIVCHVEGICFENEWYFTMNRQIMLFRNENKHNGISQYIITIIRNSKLNILAVKFLTKFTLLYLTGLFLTKYTLLYLTGMQPYQNYTDFSRDEPPYSFRSVTDIRLLKDDLLQQNIEKIFLKLRLYGLIINDVFMVFSL